MTTRDIPYIEPILTIPARLKSREEFEREWQAKYGHLSLSEFLLVMQSEEAGQA